MVLELSLFVSLVFLEHLDLEASLNVQVWKSSSIWGNYSNMSQLFLPCCCSLVFRMRALIQFVRQCANVETHANYVRNPAHDAEPVCCDKKAPMGVDGYLDKNIQTAKDKTLVLCSSLLDHRVNHCSLLFPNAFIGTWTV